MAISKDGGTAPRTRAGARKVAENPTSGRSAKSDERDVGSALRSAYQATVEESIPSEMLDLLGKLS